MQTILIIEDEEDIAEMIAFNLKRHSYNVQVAHNGIEGLQKVKEIHPHLVILDLMMPGMDGLSLFKEMKRHTHTRKIPVLILTARGQTEDKIKGLEMGADDYVTKPFSPKELILRIQNLLKRVQPTQGDAILECGPFYFNKNTLFFSVEGEASDLTATEFKLMVYLCERCNIAQDRNELLMEVMGYSSEVHSRTLDTHMKRLRKKLGTQASCLQTVRGIGYKMVIE